MGKQLKLWYRRPAKKWTDSLPIGNGRIGGMVFGGVNQERIALNEDTLWSGYPKDKNNPTASQHLDRVRRLCQEKKFGEAQDYLEAHMLGDYTESYLPLGDIWMTFPDMMEKNITNYVRELDLNRAVAYTRYGCQGIMYEREVFASYPAQAIIMKLTADHKGAITMELGATSPLRTNENVAGNQLIMEGICPSHVEPSYLECAHPIVYSQKDEEKGIQFALILEAEVCGGTIEKKGDRLCISKADSVVIKMVVRTSFCGFNCSPYLEGSEYLEHAKADLMQIEKKTYEELKKEHEEDYQKYYERVDFSLEETGEDTVATDERLENITHGKRDLHLYELIFQYGRYLLISSSREGTQPANLQGIWNDQVRAPWSSNYTLNINTEMNYWPTEICNLSEMHEPLFRMIEELRVNGAKTAKLHYGARGATAHHNTDIWRITNPVGRTTKGSVGYAYWCMGYGWLCQHLYEHYEYTQDKTFLREVAYPAIKDAALFYCDVMTKDRDGYWIISPSTSPENSFSYEGSSYKLDITTTMTTQIMKEVFQNVIYASEILEIDGEFAEQLKEKIEQLRPYGIGKRGTLMEWYDDYDEVEIHHRHISHLYALHPGHELTLEKAKELTEACRKTLLSRGDDGTGWSLGWKINAWARLGDGEHAEKLLKRQLQFVDSDDMNYSNGGGTYRNLFDAHPPFQIDGNFATCAGIAQMYLQSHDQEVLLLPALPKSFRNSHMKGLRAVGDLEVDLVVKEGKLEKAVLYAHSTCKHPVCVHYGKKKYCFTPQEGETYELSRGDFL